MLLQGLECAKCIVFKIIFELCSFHLCDVYYGNDIGIVIGHVVADAVVVCS